MPSFVTILGSAAQGPRGGGFGPMGGRGMGVFGGGPRAIVTGAPYTATEVVQSQEALADGNSITNKRQTTVSRDSQGRVRTDETVTPPASSGKAAFTLTTILDPVAGYRYVLDSSTMTAHQSTLPKPRTTTASTTAPPAPRTRTGGATVATTSLGTMAVNGVAATGTQVTETIAAGLIGNAADPGCACHVDLDRTEGPCTD